MNDQHFRNLSLKVFIFVKFRKCAKNYYEIRKLVDCFCFILYKEIKPQLKVEIEDGREAPQKPSNINKACLKIIEIL